MCIEQVYTQYFFKGYLLYPKMFCLQQKRHYKKAAWTSIPENAHDSIAGNVSGRETLTDNILTGIRCFKLLYISCETEWMNNGDVHITILNMK